MDKQDIVGKKFNKLTVLNFKNSEPSNRKWRNKHFYCCVCDCGQQINVERSILISGSKKSCGCYSNPYGNKTTNRTANNHPRWTGYGEISGKAWSHIISAAKTRDLHISITIQDAWEIFIKQNRKCKYTGCNLFFLKNSNASMDRIDSKDGYHKNNVQWVHKDVNKIKGELSESDFLNFCRLIDENFGDIIC